MCIKNVKTSIPFHKRKKKSKNWRFFFFFLTSWLNSFLTIYLLFLKNFLSTIFTFSDLLYPFSRFSSLSHSSFPLTFNLIFFLQRESEREIERKKKRDISSPFFLFSSFSLSSLLYESYILSIFVYLSFFLSLFLSFFLSFSLFFFLSLLLEKSRKHILKKRREKRRKLILIAKKKMKSFDLIEVETYYRIEKKVFRRRVFLKR